MSEFPIVTNKYCAKAEFSANICNGIYNTKFVGVNTDVEIATVSATPNTAVTVAEFEHPITMTNEFGNAFYIRSDENDNIIIRGTDYLGQPIELATEVDGGDRLIDANFKYITEIEFHTSTLHIKESNERVYLPFKTVAILATIKNGSSVGNPTLVSPNLGKNTNGVENARGKLEISEVSVNDKFTFILIADNSLVTIDGEEVGGLYGNPSVPSTENQNDNEGE